MTFASRSGRLFPRLAMLNPLRGRTGIMPWFNGRSRRERILIVLGSAALLLYGGYAGVWQPLQEMRAEALADIAKYEAVIARVSATGPNLTLAAVASPELPDAAVITDSATTAGLAIRRLEPEGARTRIEIEDADFTSLINWLASLAKEHALRVATIEIDRRPDPGMVSARISVEK